MIERDRTGALPVALRKAAATLAHVGLVPAGAQAAARGSIAVAQAKAFACDTGRLEVPPRRQLPPEPGASTQPRSAVSWNPEWEVTVTCSQAGEWQGKRTLFEG